MFGFGSIGGGELLLILVIALLLFGPRRIPEIGRTIGKTLTQLRRATQEFRTGIEREVEVEKLREAGDAMRSIRSEVGSIAADTFSTIRRDIDGATRPGTQDRAAVGERGERATTESPPTPESSSGPRADPATDEDDPDREQHS
jgi:Tat protein translocase TatB subunit